VIEREVARLRRPNLRVLRDGDVIDTAADAATAA